MPGLAQATLTDAERAALERFVSLLRESLGDDLEAVWLYGSRARGEQVLGASDAAASVSLAYYAMLYAARAALSEEDLYAKTHRGTWDLFWQTFAATGRFEPKLAEEARGTIELRQLSDYEAKRPSAEEATRVVELAERFLDAVAALIDA